MAGKDNMPRIKSISVGPLPERKTVHICWTGGGEDEVDLSGWIATGGDLLGPMTKSDVFQSARVADYGAAISWRGDDLSIDATHLRMLADEQRPFGPEQLVQWQKDARLSNKEAADFLGVALSTFNLYKARGPIPPSIGMVCRASARDPILLQAHYRPRKPGRPKSNKSREAA